MDEERLPGEPRPAERDGITAGEIRWIVGGLLAILFGVFIAQNADNVQIEFVFFSARIRLIWVFLICAVIGAVLDRLLQRRGVLPSTRRRQRKEAKDAKERNRRPQ
ncbi:MAG: LapA family protein [Actinomycetota bacterium]